MSADVCISAPITTRELAGLLDTDVSDAPAGFGGTSTTRLIRGLVERGQRVEVATLSPDVAGGQHVVLHGPGLTVRFGAYRPRHRARDAFRAERKAIESAVETAAAEVVHAHWTYEFALGALAVRPDALITIRDEPLTVLRYHLHPYRVVRLGMAVATLRRARHLSAVSPYMADAARRFARAPIEIIPNGIQADRFAEEPPAVDLAAPVLVTIAIGAGRLKNTRRLLEAFARVRSHLPGATLRILGRGHGSDEPFAAEARAAGLDQGVAFLGSVAQAEVVAHLSEAAALVHPSLEESFGNVLVEAMAQRVPVIGGERSGAVPWVLDGGRAGVLTDVSDPDALATSILDLCNDPATWQRLSDAGATRARSHFHLDRVLDAYLERYAALGTAARSRRP